MRFQYVADECPALTWIDPATGLVTRTELPPEAERYVCHAPNGVAIYGPTAVDAIKAAKRYAKERRVACGYA